MQFFIGLLLLPTQLQRLSQIVFCVVADKILLVREMDNPRALLLQPATDAAHS